jgi:hypothetical protein
MALIPALMLVTISCAPYLYSLHVPATGYTVAKSFIENNQIGIRRFNMDMAENGAAVTLADTYQAAYGKDLKDAPADGDTGQAFADMRTATRYFRNILSDKGVLDAGNYVLTRYADKDREGFQLIAVVYREDRVITVKDPINKEIRKTMDANAPAYYRPYQADENGRVIDRVVEWAAVPANCFEKQGQQAVLLTAAANHVISPQPKGDFWQATQKWENGDVADVVAAQDYLACRSLGASAG